MSPGPVPCSVPSLLYTSSLVFCPPVLFPHPQCPTLKSLSPALNPSVLSSLAVPQTPGASVPQPQALGSLSPSPVPISIALSLDLGSLPRCHPCPPPSQAQGSQPLWRSGSRGRKLSLGQRAPRPGPSAAPAPPPLLLTFAARRGHAGGRRCRCGRDDPQGGGQAAPGGGHGRAGRAGAPRTLQLGRSGRRVGALPRSPAHPAAGRTPRRTRRHTAHTRAPAPAAAAAAPGGGRPVTAPSQSAPRRGWGWGTRSRTADTGPRTPPPHVRTLALTRPHLRGGGARPAPHVHTWTRRRRARRAAVRAPPATPGHADPPGESPRGHSRRSEASSRTLTLTCMAQTHAPKVPGAVTHSSAPSLVPGWRLRDPLRSTLG